MNSTLKICDLLTEQFEERPEGTAIDTLIIHSMYDPDSEDIFSVHSCKARLESFGVSAHYLIDLEGTVWRMVPEDKRAWHAGVSRMPHPADGREQVNAFSIGIELIGSEDTDFTGAQYQALAQLCKDICDRHPIANVYGHSDIAPDRKTDPWGLDWPRVKREVEECCDSTTIQWCSAALTT